MKPHIGSEVNLLSSKFTAMIIPHFDLQPQFKYMNYFIYTSHHFTPHGRMNLGREDAGTWDGDAGTPGLGTRNAWTRGRGDAEEGIDRFHCHAVKK